MNVLLDSVILIDHLNGIEPATAYIGSVKSPAISVVTRAEVLSGPALTDAGLIAEWLDRFELLAIDRKVADTAANLRRRYRWALPDAFQAALAQIHGRKLATRNTRDFPPHRHSFVVVPYSIR